MKEKDIEDACCILARRSGVAAVKLEKNGHKGIPDRVFIFPGGECFFVEFKRPRTVTRVSGEQSYFATLLGDRHFFCSDIDAFAALLASWVSKVNNTGR